MSGPAIHFVDDPAALEGVAFALEGTESLPLDVESNGLHAYRPVLCTLQLARVRDGAPDAIWIVDTLSIGDAALGPLRRLLGADGPPKILHDLAFDARILARSGLVLDRVIDTAVAARFLGIASTGLAALVETRVGPKLSKELQHHDWGKRPIAPDALPYLAADVAHLPALARSLFDEARVRGIEEEIAIETDYRLWCARNAQDDDLRPPYVRIKGAGALEPQALAALRAVAEVREEAARRWDVPPFKVLGNEILIELARKRPSELAALRSMRGLDRGRAASLAPALHRAIVSASVDVPAEERAAWFTAPPRPPRAVVELRRAREGRLLTLRRRLAKERTVDEQVVLPGHCVQDLLDRVPRDQAALAEVPGLGAARIVRDGAAILEALALPGNGAGGDGASASDLG
jgi:ribonuclease D